MNFVALLGSKVKLPCYSEHSSRDKIFAMKRTKEHEDFVRFVAIPDNVYYFGG